MIVKVQNLFDVLCEVAKVTFEFECFISDSVVYTFTEKLFVVEKYYLYLFLSMTPIRIKSETNVKVRFLVPWNYDSCQYRSSLSFLRESFLSQHF